MAEVTTEKCLALVSLALLAGCDDAMEPQYSQQSVARPVAVAQPVELGRGERVQVTRLSVFKDSLAYDGKRGVYLIRDTETGAEYIGVSGVGIAQVGRHHCGKNCVREDER
jgi:hypothetical protein